MPMDADAVADRLSGRCAKVKSVLPDDLLWVTGSIGLLGTEPSWKLMNECDTLLMIGSGFLIPSFFRKKGARWAYKLISRPACCRSDSRWKSGWSATPQKHCARCCRGCSKDRSFLARRLLAGLRRDVIRRRGQGLALRAGLSGSLLRSRPFK